MSCYLHDYEGILQEGIYLLPLYDSGLKFSIGWDLPGPPHSIREELPDEFLECHSSILAQLPENIHYGCA